METPYVCSALMWYGVVYDIIWDHMISYRMGSISYFLFQGKDLVLCNHWNFLCTLADLLPNPTMWSRRPKSYFLCWSKKERASRGISPLDDPWICQKLFSEYPGSLALLCCLLLRIAGRDLLFANKRPNCQTAKLPLPPRLSTTGKFQSYSLNRFLPHRTHTHPSKVRVCTLDAHTSKLEMWRLSFINSVKSQ